MPPPAEPPSDSDRTLHLHQVAGPTAASTDFELGSEGPGTLGEYELIAEIGAGGMGRVYRAKQRDGRVVALKTLLPQYVATPALVQRFRKEAEAAGQLHHAGIVPVYNWGEADGKCFFTMALVEGRGLDTRLRQGPLENRRAALVVQRTAEALAYAHHQGVVHRDVKPSNILVDRDGGVKVTDFGLARRLDAKDLDALDEAVRAAHPVAVGTVARMTRAGAVMGTPGYMAPEQATASSQVGPAADIWALGAVLYACLTGRAPFVGADAIETLALTAEAEPVPPDEINPDADPELVHVCLKCLRKVPAERYASADDVAAELARWRDGHSARTPSEVWRGKVARFFAGAPELVPLLAGLAVNRLGNVQEGIFVGCAVAGIGLARRSSAGLLILPLVALILFFASFLAGSAATASPPWAAGTVVSVTALLGVAFTLTCGLMALVPGKAGERARLAATIGSIGGLVGLAASVALELGDERLRDLGPDAGNVAAVVASYVGRAAAWLLAIPLGLAAGALLGRLNHLFDRLGREPAPAFALGAAPLAVFAAWFMRELRPDWLVTQAARFEALGPGPLLSFAEERAYRWLPAGAEARLAAAAGVFWLKLLLLAVPMLVGGAAATLTARLAGGGRR